MSLMTQLAENGKFHLIPVLLLSDFFVISVFLQVVLVTNDVPIIFVVLYCSR